MFRYVVTATFADPAVAERWLAWMRDGHLQDVLDAGAQSGEAIRLDGEPLTLEAHFRFADRAAFEAYERDGAPRLRAEGLELFPPEAGVTYRRRTGEVAVRGG